MVLEAPVATTFPLGAEGAFGKRMTHPYLGLESPDQHTRTPYLQNYLILPEK